MTARRNLVCLALGLLLEPAWGQLPLQDGYAVVSYYSLATVDPGQHRLAIFNTNDSQMVLGPCNSTVTIHHGAGASAGTPDWTEQNLSSVFGLALDRKRNIFACATRLYGGCTTLNGPSGAVYRIEGGVGGATAFAARGTVNLFCQLPNGTANGSLGEGLGNICYDEPHNQFFVSNLDDGLIYRLPNLQSLPVTSNDWTTYDHGIAALSPAEPDVATQAFTSHKRRVWAVAMHQGRLFYSIWRNDEGYSTAAGTPPGEATASNEIWSVGIAPIGGGFLPLTARLELELPKHAVVTYDWSMPVSDICFPTNGDRVFFAERSVSDDCGFAAHRSRLLEYVFEPHSDTPYDWYPSPVDKFQLGEYGIHTNACGGVSVDIQNRPWVSVDALNYGDSNGAPCVNGSIVTQPYVYGYQRLPVSGNQSLYPVTSTSNIIDIDENVKESSKSFPGSIRVYNPPCFNLGDVGPPLAGLPFPHADAILVKGGPWNPGPFPIIFGGSFSSIGGVAANNIAASDGVTWVPVGTGTNGPVHCLAVYDDGTGPALYAGGEFTSAGGAPANNIAKWNGSAWTALGGGLTSQFCATSVRALAVYDDGSGPALFVGGDFQNAGGPAGVVSSGIAKWNGTNWVSLGGGFSSSTDPGGCPGLPAGSPFPGQVDALMVFDQGSGPELYVGGRFDGVVNSAQILLNLAKWNGAGFSPVGTGVDGRVRALTTATLTDHAMIVVGGDFLNAGGVSALRVASWDPPTGAWSALGSGANGAVRDLAVLDLGEGPEVYACGDFTAIGGVSAGYVAKWDGLAWSSAGLNLGSPASNLYVPEEPNSSNAMWVTGAYPLAIARLRPCCPPITITVQPVGMHVSLSASFTLSVQASSTTPLTYQWKKDGVDIPNATGNTYTVPSATPADLGAYAVVISNGCRWKVSHVVWVSDLPLVSVIGPGCSQGGSAPTLTSTAPPIVGTTFTMSIGSGAPNSIAALYLSPPTAFAVPLGCGCTAYLDLLSLTDLGLFVTDGTGSASLSVSVPNVPSLVGARGFVQGVLLDFVSPACGALPAGLQLTNGLDVTIGI